MTAEDEFDKQLGGNVGNGVKRTYFKPEEATKSFVLLIEPTKYNPEGRNPFAKEPVLSECEDQAEYDYLYKQYERQRTRRELTATITAFDTPEHLEAGDGRETPDVVITQAYLAGDLEHSLGKLEIAKPIKEPSKTPGGGSAWKWRGVDGEVIAKVKKYYVAREQAIAEAPDYLKAG